MTTAKNAIVKNSYLVCVCVCESVCECVCECVCVGKDRLNFRRGKKFDLGGSL